MMVILFDIDGTLIDHDQAEAVAVSALRRRLDVSEAENEFRDRWRTALERHYSRYLAGELTLQGQRRERLREVIEPTLSDASADELSTAYIEDYLVACRLFPDVERALAQLGAYRMGIISNGAYAQQHHKLTQAGIARYFSSLTLSDECGVAKPAPGIFHLACASMDVRPSQAIYVGDRRDIDAEAARAAGLHGIWLDRRTSADHHPLTRVSSMSALPAVVESLNQRSV